MVWDLLSKIALPCLGLLSNKCDNLFTPNNKGDRSKNQVHLEIAKSLVLNETKLTHRIRLPKSRLDRKSSLKVAAISPNGL